MARVRFLDFSPEVFVDQVKKRLEMNASDLARMCKVNRRSFSDWQRGRYLMPKCVFDKLVVLSGVEEFGEIEILPDHWSKRDSGKKGGKMVWEKYGKIPGWTREVSRKGGINSIKSHIRKDTGYFYQLDVDFPEHSNDLAEFVGILLGDGGITEYQITITLHEFDDRDYIDYVSELGRKLFGLPVSMYSKSGSRAVDLVVSRKKLVNFFEDMGLKRGSKIENLVSVPEWIKQSKEYTRACLKGLFDTDGCFYVDKHRYGDKMYRNPAMVFTNYSLPIALFFIKSMVGLGYNPTQSWNRSKRGVNVYLRREEEVVKYYEEIGFSNTKHSRKFLEYFSGRSEGEVPKWS